MMRSLSSISLELMLTITKIDRKGDLNIEDF